MSSLLFSNFIVLLAIEEWIFLIVQWAVAIGTMESETTTTTTTRRELLSATNTVHVVIFVVTIFSWFMLIIANIAFCIAFCVIV